MNPLSITTSSSNQPNNNLQKKNSSSYQYSSSLSSYRYNNQSPQKNQVYNSNLSNQSGNGNQIIYGSGSGLTNYIPSSVSNSTVPVISNTLPTYNVNNNFSSINQNQFNRVPAMMVSTPSYNQINQSKSLSRQKSISNLSLNFPNQINTPVNLGSTYGSSIYNITNSQGSLSSNLQQGQIQLSLNQNPYLINSSGPSGSLRVNFNNNNNFSSYPYSQTPQAQFTNLLSGTNQKNFISNSSSTPQNAENLLNNIQNLIKSYNNQSQVSNQQLSYQHDPSFQTGSQRHQENQQQQQNISYTDNHLQNQIQNQTKRKSENVSQVEQPLERQPRNNQQNQIKPRILPNIITSQSPINLQKQNLFQNHQATYIQSLQGSKINMYSPGQRQKEIMNQKQLTGFQKLKNIHLQMQDRITFYFSSNQQIKNDLIESFAKIKQTTLQQNQMKKLYSFSGNLNQIDAEIQNCEKQQKTPYFQSILKIQKQLLKFKKNQLEMQQFIKAALSMNINIGTTAQNQNSIINSLANNLMLSSQGQFPQQYDILLTNYQNLQKEYQSFTKNRQRYIEQLMKKHEQKIKSLEGQINQNQYIINSQRDKFIALVKQKQNELEMIKIHNIGQHQKQDKDSNKKSNIYIEQNKSVEGEQEIQKLSQMINLKDNQIFMLKEDIARLKLFEKQRRQNYRIQTHPIQIQIPKKLDNFRRQSENQSSEKNDGQKIIELLDQMQSPQFYHYRRPNKGQTFNAKISQKQLEDYPYQYQEQEQKEFKNQEQDKKLSQVQKMISLNYNHQIQAFQGQIQSLKRKIASLEGLINTKNNTLVQSKSQIQDLKVKNQKIESMYQELKKKFDESLPEKRQQLQKQIQLYKGKIQDYQKNINDMKQMFDKNEKEIQRQRSSALKNAASSKVFQNKVIYDLKKENQSLKKKLIQRWTSEVDTGSIKNKNQPINSSRSRNPLDIYENIQLINSQVRLERSVSQMNLINNGISKYKNQNQKLKQKQKQMIENQNGLKKSMTGSKSLSKFNSPLNNTKKIISPTVQLMPTFFKQKNQQLQKRIQQLITVNNELKIKLNNMIQSNKNSSHETLNFFKNQLLQSQNINKSYQYRMKHLNQENNNLRRQLSNTKLGGLNNNRDRSNSIKNIINNQNSLLNYDQSLSINMNRQQNKSIEMNSDLARINILVQELKKQNLKITQENRRKTEELQHYKNQYHRAKDKLRNQIQNRIKVISQASQGNSIQNSRVDMSNVLISEVQNQNRNQSQAQNLNSGYQSQKITLQYIIEQQKNEIKIKNSQIVQLKQTIYQLKQKLTQFEQSLFDTSRREKTKIQRVLNQISIMRKQLQNIENLYRNYDYSIESYKKDQILSQIKLKNVNLVRNCSQIQNLIN